MNKITLLAACFFLSIPFIILSQDLLKDYELPKLIEGSNLNFNAGSNFSANNERLIYRSFRIGIFPVISKFRYSDKLNYIVNLRANTDYFHNYASYFETKVSNTYSARFEIDGALNYYFSNKKFYTGLNVGSNSDFSSNNMPSYVNYTAPLIGYGKLINALEISRVNYFEQVLKDEKVIKENLPYNTQKKLVELFDKRNNREFIYKFKEDNEIEFFSQVENLLKSEGIINGNMSARTVLKLYQTLMNGKFLLYPKYKGYQLQAMFFYPFGSIQGNNYGVNPELFISGMYGIPLSIKTQLSIFGFFSKVIKVSNDPDENYLFNTKNIFPLSVERTQLDFKGFSYPIGYSIVNSSSKNDFYFGSFIEVFHNFSGFFGLRGYINSTTYSADKKKYSYLIQETILDFGIISKAVLSCQILSIINFRDNYRTTYEAEASVSLSYIIF